MKTKKLLFLLLVLFSTSTLLAQQPYSGCWHPDFIKDWTPEKDPDAKFNVSSVPLQTRFKDETVKANQYQFYDGQNAACLTMNPSASTTPAQGANNFIGYNPTYWQYLDILVWWGGSSGEGIILPPSAPVVDAAHLSGVKVLGQIFLPPSAFGGQSIWTKQLLENQGGVYPYARKLLDIAEYYGFDGWFINNETVTSSNWNGFFKDYMAYAKERGLKDQELQYYNMSSSTQSSDYDMYKLPGASFMVNYGGVSGANADMSRHVNDFQLTKEDGFHTYYYGIEQAQGGIGGNASHFKSLFPKTGHVGSVQIFNPEEGIWKKVVENLLNTTGATGQKAYTAMNTVFANESRFWTNLQNDPSNTTSRDAASWPGLANAMMERSTIQTLPFVTTFSAGLGKHRFLDGENKGTQDWYHRGMQTIMPTWRWWFETNSAPQNQLKFDLNWDDAYNVGTSIAVSGKLSAGANNTLRLYKTKLLITSGDKLQFVYKTNTPGSIGLKLAIAEDGNSLTTLTAESSTIKNGWTVDEYNLNPVAGKTISVIALDFKVTTTVSAYTASLGQLSAYSASNTPPSAVKNLAIQNKLTSLGGDVRVVWDNPDAANIHHFNVYLEKQGVKSLVGQTRNEGFYIPKFVRTSASEKGVKVYVASVNNRMEEGSHQMIESQYPEIDKSVVKLKASKTLVKIGEEVSIAAIADNYPETYTWSTPEGATVVKQSPKGDTITYKFTKEGYFDIKVAVTNQIGTTEMLVNRFINASDSEQLALVSVGKTIHSFSGSLPPEDPHWLIDGVQVPGNIRNKWCIGGSKEHWVVIDLEDVYEIYRFQIFDCGNKENYADNFKYFKIYTAKTLTGNDAEDWTLVVDEANRPENTKNDYIKPTFGRYVKFVPYDPETPITIRIWEFEVHGIQKDTGMNEQISGNKKFEVYPIPVNAGQDIKISGENISSVKLYSLQGMLVSQMLVGNETLKTVSTANLIPGIYMMQITGSDKVEVVRVIIR